MALRFLSSSRGVYCWHYIVIVLDLPFLLPEQEEMGQPLSGFDQWQAIVGRRTDVADGPVRAELVLGHSSYTLDADSTQLVPMSVPRGAYIYDGWKIVMGDR